MIERNTMLNDDCFNVLPLIDNNSINLIIADIPYYKVMVRTHAGEKVDWDSQWKTLQDYLDWCEKLAIQFKRVLTANGTIYLFGDDKIIAYLQVLFDKYFNIENSIVWVKPNNMTIKGWAKFRSYAPITERILMYSNEVIRTGLEEIKLDVNNSSTLRNYFKELQAWINLPKSKIVDIVGQQVDHCFRHSSSQFDLPTLDTYKKLIEIFNISSWNNYKEYEILRRPFNITENYTDIWTHNIIAPKEKFKGGHTTQKPIAIIKRIISVSSNIGDLVADFTAGSMTTAVAAIDLERDFIVVEKDEKIFLNGQERVNSHIDKLYDAA